MAAKKPKAPKPRLPMPTKPPKVEPNPSAYDRRQKHKQGWDKQIDDDEATAEKDK